MERFPEKLRLKLEKRKEESVLRGLPVSTSGIDFSSNDYLGFSRLHDLSEEVTKILKKYNAKKNGATGSRLLTGNHELYTVVENRLAQIHEAEAALIFNSGYDANVGVFSSIAQKGDVVLYDEYIHASIRDGIQLSYAESYKFKHNDLIDLEKKIKRTKSKVGFKGTLYVVTESIFSMDGDHPDLKKIVALCEENKSYLIIDEAHAVGVFGINGVGMIQEYGLHNAVFARIMTFGKGLGCHGAVVIGSQYLKQYLVNFARSFIYTTGLPPHSLAVILASYNKLSQSNLEQRILQTRIKLFKKQIEANKLTKIFVESNSAIHCCIIPGNERVTTVAQQLQDKGYTVKSIKSPTVPVTKERLRFCLHNYNSEKEIKEVLYLLATFVKS